ncbi:protein phosphatase 1 regulatory subunit 3B-B [Neocloeon triangulifer]|uniref:protein phosphatase 1 regulatory subunit 3B-B n=1 Tax=Neocloeon triangulifer TaxID=2078957 RepID=UPI00286F6E18|nr:protein phosphatase 1 regulatory subunit 3B-B [Neocloeon triangulifer]
MPADYEMMIASSPPVFSRSPPVSSCLATNYNYLCNGLAYANDNNRSSLRRREAHQQQMNPKLRVAAAAATTETTLAKSAVLRAQALRPCLVVKPDEDVTDGDASRLKKRVVFADDKGLSLTHIRIMSEPSHCPPLWTVDFIAQVTKGASVEVAPEPWEVTFPQPASDYLNFRQRLEQTNVSLENVIVKEAEELIVGTVKVKNISFHKQVFVRVTFDDWATHEDAHCTFVQNSPASLGPSQGALPGCIVLYDTFSFQLRLQPRAKRVEFCVCFLSDGREHWDNNSDMNYVLVKSVPPADKTNNNNRIIPPPSGQQRFNDAVRAKMDSWSEFASWNHLVNDSPYW